jgi:hypothetical protein
MIKVRTAATGDHRDKCTSRASFFSKRDREKEINPWLHSSYHSIYPTINMGKSQKKKVMRRHNPMRVPDSHLPKGLASASESSSKSNEILPILQRVRASCSFGQALED